MTIPNALFYDPRPQFLDANNKPLDNGATLTFYSAGTTSLKAVYADSSLDTPLDNPLTLDAGGYVPEGGVWLAEGSYKLVVKNSLGAIEWTQDNIAGAGLSGGGSSAFGYVNSIDELSNVCIDSLKLKPSAKEIKTVKMKIDKLPKSINFGASKNIYALAIFFIEEWLSIIF